MWLPSGGAERELGTLLRLQGASRETMGRVDGGIRSPFPELTGGEKLTPV
jgi:hypothetical protein